MKKFKTKSCGYFLDPREEVQPFSFQFQRVCRLYTTDIIHTKWSREYHYCQLLKTVITKTGHIISEVLSFASENL